MSLEMYSVSRECMLEEIITALNIQPLQMRVTDHSRT